MKVPSHILKAPPTHLDENMIKVFNQIGFGCIPIWTDKGCSVFVHVDKRTIKESRYAVHSIVMELNEIDGCPMIRIDIKIYDDPLNPLHMDCFLNILDKQQNYSLEALCEQERLVFHWYDEDLCYVRSSAVSWSSDNRNAAKKIVEQAYQIINLTGGDFDAAKRKFIAENPLD